MIKQEEKIDNCFSMESNFSALPEPVTVVTKDNFHQVLGEFKSYLLSGKCKYVFLNVEFTNSQKFTKKINLAQIEDDNLNFLSSLIKNVVNSKNIHNDNADKKQAVTYDNSSQILFTEILIVKEKSNEKDNFKLIPYLIPTIKFHKFTERESFLNIDSETLTYFNFINDFIKFSSVCDAKSLSYLNLNEEETICKKFERILTSFKSAKKSVELSNENSRVLFNSLIQKAFNGELVP